MNSASVTAGIAIAIAEGVLIFGLLAWKARELSHVPRRIPLRFVAALLAFAGAAWPLGVLYALRTFPAADRWLTAAQDVIVTGCAALTAHTVAVIIAASHGITIAASPSLPTASRRPRSPAGC